MSKFQFLSVNWISGMGVSPDHFIAQENFFMERLLEHTALARYPNSFGLLPSHSDNGSLVLRLSGTSSYAKLILESYIGVTPGGLLIRFEDTRSYINLSLSEIGIISEQGWDILLTVDPYKRVNCGVADLRETPPRYPYTEPALSLKLMPHDDKARTSYDSFSVIIGLLRSDDTGFFLDNNFIPPSLFMSSHPELRAYMSRFTEVIARIDSHVRIIIEKAQNQPKRTSEAESVLVLCKEVLRSFNSFYFDWCNGSFSLTPYRTIEILTRLVSSVYTGLCYLAKKDKEEVLRYFYEWNGISPSTFEQQLDEVIRKPYNHNIINHSMVAIQGVLLTLDELFGSLSRLEFVGQHKEGIVISERRMQDTPSSENRWALLD